MALRKLGNHRMDVTHSASFRDPDGFLFHRDGRLYRQVNRSGQPDYDRLMASGLYGELTGAGLLIPHQEADVPPADPAAAYRVIAPEPVPLVSYPYEWSFSQLRDAALATLEIQQRAFRRGLSLKDASAYNIQFVRGRPLLIDTLSFEAWPEGRPWVAYRQFCQHFLAPLALMARTDVRLGQLLRVHLDGLPLDLAAALLPRRARLAPSLAMHIVLHSRSQKKHEGEGAAPRPAARPRAISRMGFQGIIASLERAVRKLEWAPAGTQWGDYYSDTNYSAAGIAHKRELLEQIVARVEPRQVWDLGANNGFFSRVASRRGIPTVAFDVDPAAVEQNYREVRRLDEPWLLPLLQDLTNPSPALGWAGAERASLLQRGPADLVMGLALVHHLAIANNVPLDRLADFFAAACGRWLVLEWVPKPDSQVQRLLATREDVFPHYVQEGFERAFAARFHIREALPVRDSQRRLYLMERRRDGESR